MNIGRINNATRLAAIPSVGLNHVRGHSLVGGTLIAIIFWLFVIPKALWPATKTGGFHAGGMYLSWDDPWLVAFCITPIACRLLRLIPYRLDPLTRRRLIYPLVALAGYAAVSVVWNGQDGIHKSYSFVQAALFALVVGCAAALCSGLPSPVRHKVAAVVLGGVMLIVSCYLLITFLAPGLRPSFNPDAAADEDILGYFRLRGPIAASTTILFILFPAMTLALSRIISGRGNKLLNIACVLLLAFAILGTASRGALLAGACLVLLWLLAHSLRAAIYVATLGAIVAGVIGIAGYVPQRLTRFDDNARSVTYATAWNAFTADPIHLLVGHGQGALYEDLQIDRMVMDYGKNRWFRPTKMTEYGYTLTRSHSMLFRTLAETGIIGGILLGLPIGWLVIMALRATRFPTANKAAVAAAMGLSGCVAVIPYMMFEELVTRGNWPMLLWLIFTILAVENVKEHWSIMTRSRQQRLFATRTLTGRV